ncbi:MAG: prolipoprotein diacylglyceryl transferase [Pseudomonadota bacterium]|nr:prolipoprotein diacylglyceryl transferase [Pseudomonadales bacterium]MDY6922301.1 prolipoprotein diacylglyceryl transferase [Pseudomonadota bacterium]
MLKYPEIDPVAIQLGPLSVRWYGIMYLIGFVSAYWLLARRARRPGSGWTVDQVSDLIFYGAVGVILGGRIGYVLFYNFSAFLQDPLLLIKIWQGGMSFHGGFLGVILAVALFARKTGKNLWDILDFGAPVVPIGLGAGRIGNFIGGELVGRVTDVPWGMVFPHVDNLPRHPSQLYQAALEGLALFCILWFFSAKPRPRYAVSGLFALCYGVFRFGVEFVRQPDEHLGFIALHWLTMGQILSLPMIVLGAFLLYLAYGRRQAPAAPQQR